MLRAASRRVRTWVRTWVPWLRVQRTARLLPEDATWKRRRPHVLVDLVNRYCPGSRVVVAEVGVRTGATAAHLLKYCPQIEKIYAVDLERPPPEEDRVSRLERVEFLQGYSDACAARVDDASIDLVFLDADHSAAWVARDLDAWVPKVKPGGVIAGHDYGSHRHPDVRVVVDRYFASHRHPIRLDANKVWWTVK